MKLRDKIPLIFFSPTMKCNSRCITCDYWKNSEETSIDIDQTLIIDTLKKVGTKRLVITWWEPLLYKDLVNFCKRVKKEISDIEIRLLTNWLLLSAKCNEIIDIFDQIIISIDWSNKALYKKIRWIDWFDILMTGVKKVKKLNPNQIIRWRSTIQKANYTDIPYIIDLATDIWLDQISFLPINIDSTLSFGRREKLGKDFLLEEQDIEILSELIDKLIISKKSFFESNYIAESPEILRKILVDYFRNIKTGWFVYPKCNSPEISQYIDSSGRIYPCFFLNSIWNLKSNKLLDIYHWKENNYLINKVKSWSFEECKNCVCPLFIEKKFFY